MLMPEDDMQQKQGFFFLFSVHKEMKGCFCIPDPDKGNLRVLPNITL